MQKLFSNEIVFRGHPDKVCDQIGAALLRAFIDFDKESRCGIEVVGGKDKIFITGEVSSYASPDIDAITRRVLRDCGYDPNKYEIINNIGLQSLNISIGVNKFGGEIGAGDQGMMFGYACNETSKYLPKAMVILQEFAEAYDNLRQTDERFLSDGKAQITGYYTDEFELTEIKTFTISYQNTEFDRVATDEIIKNIANNICKKYDVIVDEFLINPTGLFTIGGFDGDAGLTGRKIVVDSYQGFANVGGGNMNAKDPSKVDFSASHKSRELAKRILKEKNLKWCEVQLSYAIGLTKPLAIYIDSNIGNIEPTNEMYEECTPKRIIEDLKLLDADYEELAKFGHFRN